MARSYERGDLVRVKGFGGREGLARVWEVRDRGYVLCSQSGYEKLLRGESAARVGYPRVDVIALAAG